MNEEIIKINETEYIKKEMYDEALKSPIKRMDFAVPNTANVMAIIPMGKYESDLEKDILNIEGLSKFKKFDEKINASIDKKHKIESFIIKDSKYSWEFIQIAIKTAKSFGYSEDAQFYLGYDEQKKETKKDFPLLIKIGLLCFILAPRVESD